MQWAGELAFQGSTPERLGQAQRAGRLTMGAERMSVPRSVSSSSVVVWIA